MRFNFTTASIANPDNWEGGENHDENEVIENFDDYAHPENAWTSRTSVPTMEQYKEFMVALHDGLAAGKAFELEYCGERITVEVAK